MKQYLIILAIVCTASACPRIAGAVLPYIGLLCAVGIVYKITAKVYKPQKGQ